MSSINRRRLPLYGLLTANLISRVGNNLTNIAIPWFVLATTGSAAKTGLVAAAGILPIIVTGVLGGPLIDRLGYKRTAVISDVASGVNVALIPLLYSTVGLPFWALLTLVLLGAVLDSPGNAARVSLMPDLAGLAAMPLERANSIIMIAGRTSAMLGAPLAGLLIATIGSSNLLWIDAISFGISAVVLVTTIPNRVAAAVSETAVQAGISLRAYLAEIIDGFRFMRRDGLILWLTVGFSLGSLLAEPVYSVIMPVYAKEVYGSALDLGLMYSALGAGSILGATLFAVFGHRMPRRATMLTGFTVRALSFWVLVAMPPIGIVVAAIVINATALEPTNPMIQTIYQERIPDGMRGRVFGTVMAIGVATAPVGMIGYGLLIGHVGLQTSLYIFAAINLTLPLMLALMPAFRLLGSPAGRPGATSPGQPALPV
ncbi:MAG TPA: MFS transporter [Thermomicrobiales bacterium]|nr:MFS transporter [Thermomicrobiales bacterium]